MDSQFKVGNLVMISNLGTPVDDLGRIFNFMTVHYHDYTVGTKLPGMKRETVPYFGHENVIVGLKHGKNWRGIIRPKGHLPNLIGADIQLHGKNYNIKLGNKKMQLAGAKSEKNGVEAFAAFIDHLNMTQYNSTKLVETKDKETMYEWLKCNANFEKPDEVFDLADTYPNKEDIHALKYLTMFIPEYKTLDEYLIRVENLMSMTEPALGFNSDGVSFRNTEVCNGLYTYSLGKTVSLIKLSHYLSGLIKDNGNNYYGISFHNWTSNTQVKVVMPINNTDESSPNPNSEEAKKLQSHRFTISQNGSTRQNSPTSPAVAYEQYRILKSHFDIFTS